VIHVEHLQQIITLNDVQVAVGESADVGCRLADSCLIAELVTKHVSLPYTRHHQLNFSASLYVRCNKEKLIKVWGGSTQPSMAQG